MKSNRCILRRGAVILALTVSAVFSLEACAKEHDDAGIITMTTATSEVWFTVVMAKGADNLTIDWGDGKRGNSNDHTSFDVGTFVFTHNYSDKAPRKIVITGNIARFTCVDIGLTALNISNNSTLTYLDCRQNQLTVLDVSRSTALTELRCNSNQLTALDVSRNTALNNLECNQNQITKLDVSKNTALWALYCAGNQLTAAALNDLFRSLPVKTETEFGTRAIFISYKGAPEAGNPGNRDCDRSIAEKRGWVFMTIR